MANRFSMVPGRTRINVKLTENNGSQRILTFQALRSVKKIGTVSLPNHLIG